MILLLLLVLVRDSEKTRFDLATKVDSSQGMKVMVTYKGGDYKFFIVDRWETSNEKITFGCRALGNNIKAMTLIDKDNLSVCTIKSSKNSATVTRNDCGDCEATRFYLEHCRHEECEGYFHERPTA